MTNILPVRIESLTTPESIKPSAFPLLVIGCPTASTIIRAVGNQSELIQTRIGVFNITVRPKTFFSKSTPNIGAPKRVDGAVRLFHYQRRLITHDKLRRAYAVPKRLSLCVPYL